MLLEPPASSYDLNLRLFGTPIRVSPWFWLVTAIFGWMWVDLGLIFLAMWVACVFVSILLHEFGHIWAGKAFGSDGAIVMYGLGGLAIGSNDLRHRWQRIVVSLAGPGIQFVVYGAIWLALKRIGPDAIDEMPPKLRIALSMLMFINLYWPLFNLVPVWPLDGGMVAREVCQGIARHNGIQISLKISIAVAAFLAIHALIAEHGKVRIPYLPVGMYVALLFGVLAFESYQLLQHTRFMHYEPPDDRLPWER